MKRVVILSPYKGDIAENVEYAWRCVIDSMKRGEAPWASHLFYTQIMEDSDPAQRSLGFACEAVWIRGEIFVAFYLDRGISKGIIKTKNMFSKTPKILFPIEMRKIK